MKVKFIEYMNDVCIPVEFWKSWEYEGEVISSHKSFWGNTYLTVACKDGKIRETLMEDAKIIEP